MALLVFKNNTQIIKAIFSSKLCHQWSIGLLVLLTRTFFPREVGTGTGTDTLKDIKNNRQNWPRGQISKKKYYHNSFKLGFLTI